MIILIVIIMFACLLIYYFIFNIYEVKYSVEPAELYADNAATAEINTIPVNSTGSKVPLRHSSASFNITQGSDLVDIIYKNEEKGKLILRAKGSSGKVVVFMKSNHAIMPSSVEIIIYPNLSLIKDKGEKNL